MNIFENYYGNPQGTVNLYGFGFPVQWYNTIWFEKDTKHIQPLIHVYEGQEVVPKENALDLVEKLFRVYNTLTVSENLRLEMKDRLDKYEENQNKKDKLILANNDVMKNNQEMEKIHENREDRLFDRNNDQTKYWMDKYQSKENEYDKKLKDKEEEHKKDLKSKEEEYDKKLKDEKEEYDKKLKSKEEDYDKKLKDEKDECNKKLKDKEKEVKANAEKLKYLINILIDNKIEINKDIINNSIDKIFNFKEDDDNE